MAFIIQDYKHLGARSITESIRSLGQSEGQEDDDEELAHARQRLDERSRKAVRGLRSLYSLQHPYKTVYQLK